MKVIKVCRYKHWHVHRFWSLVEIFSVSEVTLTKCYLPITKLLCLLPFPALEDHVCSQKKNTTIYRKPNYLKHSELRAICSWRFFPWRNFHLILFAKCWLIFFMEINPNYFLHGDQPESKPFKFRVVDIHDWSLAKSIKSWDDNLNDTSIFNNFSCSLFYSSLQTQMLIFSGATNKGMLM